MGLQLPSRVWTRAEDGSEVVDVLGPKTFRFRGEVYRSARSLLRAVSPRSKSKHWTLPEYFKACTTRDASPTLDEVFASFKRVLGIDLARKHDEIRRILFRGFGSHIRAGGHSFEDVLQEVYKGLLVRNHGRCPYDPAKSSFGHYVWMVCSCVIKNYHRHAQRISVEATGVRGLDGDDVDVGDSNVFALDGAQGVSDVLRDVVRQTARKDQGAVRGLLGSWISGVAAAPTVSKPALKALRSTLRA